MDLDDQKFIRLAIEIAQRARDNGNHPFGALLVDQSGQILLEAENSVVTIGDKTGHAEINLLRKATSEYPADFLAGCTIYASTEPCAMCCGAIFWSNIRRVVYGLGEEKLYELVGWDSEEILLLPSGEIFSRGRKAIQVIGPMLENEAVEVHRGFWHP